MNILNTKSQSIFSKFIQLDVANTQGVSLHYYDTKNTTTEVEKEKTLIFLHGLGANATIWMPCIEHIYQKDKIRCIAIDLPNHGQSGQLNPIDMPILINSIAQYLDKIDADNITIIGHSFSSTLLLHTANNSIHARKIMQYVLISPIGIQTLSERDIKLVKNIYDIRFLMKMGKLGSYLSFKKYFSNYSKKYDEIWTKIAVDIDANPLNYYSSIHTIVNTIINQYELDKIQFDAKFHFIIGTEDILIPFKSLGTITTLEMLEENIKNVCPNSTWTVIENCGHYPQIECVNKIADLIINNL